MEIIYPDLNWYTSQSHDKKLTPRCPYANMHKCPRYYQSYALLGEAHITTAIPPKDNQLLLSKWKSNELWPVIIEHATSISGSDGKHDHFGNFCPEVSFDIFGLFAEHLGRYADEIDRENAEICLKDQGVSDMDWRWQWGSVLHMHYSNCPLYSQIDTSQPVMISSKPDEIISLEPKIFGLKFNVKNLISRFCRWWLSRYSLK